MAIKKNCKVIIAKQTKPADHFLKYAPAFYKTFPHDYEIDVKLPVSVLKTNTILEVLNWIRRSGSRDIVIVSHANRDGLFLKIPGNLKQWKAITYLLHYTRLNEAYQGVKGKGLRRKVDRKSWYRVIGIATTVLRFSGPLQAYHTLMASVKSTTAKSKAVRDFTKAVDAINNNTRMNPARQQAMRKALVKKASEKVEQRLKWFQTELGVSNAVLKSYSDALRLARLTGTRLNSLEIRGCNIGKREGVLKILGVFFNARQVIGLNVVDLFGQCEVRIPATGRTTPATRNANFRRSMSHYLRRYIGSRQRLQFGRGTRTLSARRGHQALYYNPRGLAADKDELLFAKYLHKGAVRTFVIAEHSSILGRFTKAKFGSTGRGVKLLSMLPQRKGKFFPVQYLVTKPLLFPQDKGFRTHLKRFTIPRAFDL